jgi:glyoxylase-like metal-dependent hydrolase (beta-lactamase superfamily II)
MEVADDVIAIIQGQGELGVSNAVLLVEGADAVLVDSMLLPEMAAGAIGEANKRSARIRLVVNTHHHIDHIGGNGAFGEIPVVADSVSAAAARQMLLMDPPFGRLIPPYGSMIATAQVRPPDPFLPTDSRLPVYARALVFGPSHSAADMALWLPESGTLLAGDLCFNGVTPLAIFGDLQGWIQAIDVLLALRPTSVVPGHGPPGSAKELWLVREYLQTLQNVARAAAEAGADLEDAFRALGHRLNADWIESARHRDNLRAAMSAAVGSPSPFLATN